MIKIEVAGDKTKIELSGSGQEILAEVSMILHKIYNSDNRLGNEMKKLYLETDVLKQMVFVSEKEVEDFCKKKEEEEIPKDVKDIISSVKNAMSDEELSNFAKFASEFLK